MREWKIPARCPFCDKVVRSYPTGLKHHIKAKHSREYKEWWRSHPEFHVKHIDWKRDDGHLTEADYQSWMRL